ncbi:MAG: DUF3459 domain-containing protein [Armatimonadetes bacterium]|nr:DUF3459 domain-containing protein [Armatimonadota bacterium]
MRRVTTVAAFASLVVLSACVRAVPVTFRYQPKEASVTSVALGGTFNGWKGDATRMSAGPDGAYTVTLDLPPGPHEYKFVVNGKLWLADPDNALTARPERNSVVWVAPAGGETARAKGDGKVMAFAVQHGPMDFMRLNRRRVRIRVRTAADDIESVSVVIKREGRPNRTVLMPLSGQDGPLDVFSKDIPLAGKVSYSFVLRDGKESWTLGPKGVKKDESSGLYEIDVAGALLLETPKWAPNTIWYQVFPERFSNGDPANDRKGPKSVADWTTPITDVEGNPNDWYWGGDLQGVIDKLPYLKDLGISGIYLNPIFDGPDTHKYATDDYLKIAPEFGDEAILRRLTTEAHRLGMRVMLAGVFNHTSVYFAPFRDVIEKQENSDYKGWYHIRRWPVLDPVKNYMGPDEKNIPYDGWWGIKWMPKVNYADPAATAYFLNIGAHWIQKAGIDGWRLDVANEVTSSFWREFRKTVKGAKGDAFIVGEVWENAAEWLQGDQFDSVMNYPFRSLVLDFFGRGTKDALAFSTGLQDLRNAYPPQATAAMFNMIGSHDVTRLKKECGEDDRRVILATLFQMTYPGSPCVYYGDEIGLSGASDPWNRAPMPWDRSKWNKGIYEAVKKAIRMRNEHPALRGQNITTLSAGEGDRVVAFRRAGGKERAVTVFNASDRSAQVSLNLLQDRAVETWRDGWRNTTVKSDNGRITLDLQPWSAAILFPAGK